MLSASILPWPNVRLTLAHIVRQEAAVAGSPLLAGILQWDKVCLSTLAQSWSAVT